MLLIPLLMVAFAAVGIYALVRALKAMSARAYLRVQHPAEPWLWREDWAQKAVREASGASAAIFLWIFGTGWMAASLPAFFAFRHREFPTNVIAVVFLAVGAAVLFAAVYHTLRRRKFGASVCRIDHLPIALGRSFRGELEARIRQLPPDGFKMRLTAVRRIVTGGGKHQSVNESLLWEEEQTVSAGAAQPSAHGARVPFHFLIPPDVQPCDERNPRDKVLWRLEVAAEVPGVDYHSTFELPVFHDDDTPFTAPVIERPHAPATQLHPSPDSGIEVQRDLEGKEEIVVGGNRGIGEVIGFVFFLLIWFGAVAVMWTVGAPKIMLIFFSAVAVFITYIAIELTLGRTRIRLGRQQLEVRRTLAGIPVGSRVLLPADIEQIVPAPGMRSGGRAFHDVVIHLRNGKRLKAGRHIVNLRDAEALAAKLLRAVR